MSDDEWYDIDERAIFAIEMHVTDEVMKNVIPEKNANDVWNRLEELYIGKSISKELNLKKQLFKLEIKEG